MKHIIAALLKPFADFMYTSVLLIPMSVVRGFVFGIIIALAIWVISLPAQLPEAADGSKKTILSDLRLFAIGVLALQALLYIIF
ncbi:hypothetical protein LLG96_08650 [bacterium]|nr:hypothetical protein [bacterium]